MPLHYLLTSSVFLSFVSSSATTVDNFQLISDYVKSRDSLLQKGKNYALGGFRDVAILLPEQQHLELMANSILMSYKQQEFEAGLRAPTRFWAARHFFEAKPYIDETPVFKIIRRIPKGASLHSHATALASIAYVIKNITYRNNLYVSIDDENEMVNFKFFAPNDPAIPILWRPIAEARKVDPNFDKKLKQQLSLNDSPINFIQLNIHEKWQRFQLIFDRLKPLLTYRPVFEDYFYQALKELYEDNIKYLEVRTTLPELYDLHGHVYNANETIQLFYDISEKFKNDYPEFLGVKLIYAPKRFTTNAILERHIHSIKQMTDAWPHFLAGFDLVGQEDIGPPLKDFLPALLQIRNMTNLFFHAGETLWNGQIIDENLVDAVLLNATRIGHAFAILKHPEVLDIVKQRNIALEICPISNQVLGLVNDLRNHPANFLIANGYPVVITADDPSLWNATGLSYDWYMTFMAMSSRHADLHLLKQLAINSINYSVMEDELKEKALAQWRSDWQVFLQQIIDRKF